MNSGRQLFTAEGEAKPADEAAYRGLHSKKVDCRWNELSVLGSVTGIEYLLYLCSSAPIPRLPGVLPRQPRP